MFSKVSQELTDSSFSAEERIGLWDQSAQQSCPWPVSVPTGRVTYGDRSSFTDNPLGIPQQKCSYRTPTVRCFSGRPAPPMPSSRWRTATSKQNRHHGKELGNESDTRRLSICGGWPDLRGKKTMQQACVLLQKVTKCQPFGTLTCLQIMSSSKEAQHTYIHTYSQCFRLGTFSTLLNKTCHRNIMTIKTTPKATQNFSMRT